MTQRPQATGLAASPGLAMLLLLAACETAPPPAAPVRPATVIIVGSAAATSMTVYAGEVQARHEANLGFRIAGKIVERPVELGTRVARGQVLARLDPADARLALVAGDAQREAAEADLALARAEFERTRQLAERKFVSSTALDTRTAQLQAAAARVNQARAQAGVAGNQLAYVTLSADREGIVTAVPGEVGQVVAAGQAVVRLATGKERDILIHVPEARVAALVLGRPALIRPANSQLGDLAGSIREVAGSADVATRTFAVRVALDDGAPGLPLGTTAAVAIPVQSGASTRLPLAAILRRDGVDSVWLVGPDNRVSTRRVEVMAWSDDGAVIKSGLADGDRVVSAGAHALSAGMQVRPLAAGAPAALDARR